MKKKDIRKDKGITLIALVVSIIIMLLFAAVSINMIAGNNSLLQRATQSKEVNIRASEKERLEIEVLGSGGTDGKLHASAVKSNILMDLNAGVSGDDFPLTVTFTDTGHSFKVDERGNVIRLDS